MNTQYRPWLLLAMSLALATGFAVYGPLAQYANYHDFADKRSLAALPHAADVLSNLGFAITGFLGLQLLWRRSEEELAASGLERSWIGYSIFFIAIMLTAVGSGWYHLQPDNERLVWDRLPIALACAGLVDAVLSEQLSRRLMLFIRALLLLLAPASVLWWSSSGDLSPYLFLQLLPLLLIPAVLLLYRAHRRDLVAYGLAIAAYVVAKGFELSDQPVYQALLVVSGHTLKHLFATLAAVAIYWLLRQRCQPGVPLA